MSAMFRGGVLTAFCRKIPTGFRETKGAPAVGHKSTHRTERFKRFSFVCSSLGMQTHNFFQFRDNVTIFLSLAIPNLRHLVGRLPVVTARTNPTAPGSFTCFARFLGRKPVLVALGTPLLVKHVVVFSDL
jgi:hypothetical protein